LSLVRIQFYLSRASSKWVSTKIVGNSISSGAWQNKGKICWISQTSDRYSYLLFWLNYSRLISSGASILFFLNFSSNGCSLVSGENWHNSDNHRPCVYYCKLCLVVVTISVFWLTKKNTCAIFVEEYSCQVQCIKKRRFKQVSPMVLH
jgi:hypothetical protein